MYADGYLSELVGVSESQVRVTESAPLGPVAQYWVSGWATPDEKQKKC